MPPVIAVPGVQKALRFHIGIFGKRNAGKSSLINAVTNQSLSIVSDVPGTTTDPVEKATELHPVGPVVWIDTAGIDDTADALGLARVKKSRALLSWMDLAVIVLDASKGISETEEELIGEVKTLAIPGLLVLNQADKAGEKEAASLAARYAAEYGIEAVSCSAAERTGIDAVRDAVVKLLTANAVPDLPLVEGLVKAHETALLVVPIDNGAPKGRLIPPQVQSIRETLDRRARCFVVTEDQVADAIASLKTPPAAVITDSQAIRRVAPQVPESVPLTTFSILLARSKSDLCRLAAGARAIARVKPGDRVLICETCSHNAQDGDIGRVKIPNWIAQKAGGAIRTDIAVSKDFPTDLSPYKLVVQCGGCMVTRRHMLLRLRECERQGIPMTNYGVAISYLQGVLERVLTPFPEALEAYRTAE